jgi:hypothetical protein
VSPPWRKRVVLLNDLVGIVSKQEVPKKSAKPTSFFLGIAAIA